ncbi:uncharacterized protein LOC102307985 [Haplochromis burtoni]|uniref:uncharacterized protein LOC102307985 n=1 Tax=Haplochromis burtoni TaxID=8153 RepID=UPI001C2CDAA9|nr:uncharacterized protein LOC102307985 [Haplochromis burtoni]
MTGRALQWAQAVLNTQPSVSYDVFLSKFRCVFDKGASSDAAGHRMFSLKQGRRSVADFSVEFWILAEESGWEEKALHGAFLNSLNKNIKRERPHAGVRQKNLPTLMWRSEEEEQHGDEEQPMQLGGAKLSSSRLGRKQRTDEELAKILGLPLLPLPEVLKVSALNGGHLASVTHRTQEAKGYVTDWSTRCHEQCLLAAVPDNPGTASAKSSSPPDLSLVPAEYHDLGQVFSKSKVLSLPPHRPYDCGIDLLPGAPLPTSWLYSLSKPERETMERYITESLAAGIIRPSTLPLAAGFFFVKKKDKSLRPCTDFRGLNKITVRNKYPLPLLASAFELLQGALLFTKLDLQNAYHLVCIRKGDEWKTAFNTHLEHFEYLVMPFGLGNAPAVFQALINDVLRDFINHFVFVYLDDILIFSRSQSEHINHVRLVLRRLLENRLFVKAEKCEFHVQTVSFLGFIVEQGRLRADLAKVKAVVEWPIPKTRKEVQRFLGFANFYRYFIRDFSKVALPLTNLTYPKLSFQWSSAAQQGLIGGMATLAGGH